MAQKTSVKDNESDGRAVASKMLGVEVLPWKIKNVQKDMIGMPHINHEGYVRYNDAEFVITNEDGNRQCFSHHGVVPDAYFIVPSGTDDTTALIEALSINNRPHTLVAVEIVHTNDLTKSKLLRYGNLWFDFDGTDAWDLRLVVVYIKDNGMSPQLVTVDLKAMSDLAFREHVEYMNKNHPNYFPTLDRVFSLSHYRAI